MADRKHRNLTLPTPHAPQQVSQLKRTPRKRSGAARVNIDWQKSRVEHTLMQTTTAARTSLRMAFCFPRLHNSAHHFFVFPHTAPPFVFPLRARLYEQAAPFLFSCRSHKHDASRFPSASRFPPPCLASALPRSALSQVPNKIQSSRIWLWSSWCGLQEGIGRSSQEEYQQNERGEQGQGGMANQDEI
jgi:hypothetical protein